MEAAYGKQHEVALRLSSLHSRYAQLHADRQNLLLPTAARTRLDVTASLKIDFHLNDNIKLQICVQYKNQPINTA